MESDSIQTAWPRRLTVVPMLLMFSTGCHLFPKHEEEVTYRIDEPAGRVAAMWDNRVHLAPDPVHGGVPKPGLTGRVYLFGKEIAHPLKVHGDLIVELYDHTGRAPGADPRRLEEWRFPPEVLELMFQKDPVGVDCYSVFLPWATYRPDIKDVYLTVKFTPTGGETLMAPGSMVTIDHSSTQEVWQSAAQSVAPARVPAAPSGQGEPSRNDEGSELILPEPRPLP